MAALRKLMSSAIEASKLCLVSTSTKTTAKAKVWPIPGDSRVQRDLSSSTRRWKWKPSDEKTDAAVPPSKMTVTLRGADDRLIGRMTKSEAQRLAKKKELKMVLMQERGQRGERGQPASSDYSDDDQTYKLMTGTQLHQQRMEEKSAKKEFDDKGHNENKTLVLRAKITDHDLQSRIKAVKKWLKSNHPVRVTIQGVGESEQSVDRIASIIEDSIKEIGKLHQKRLVEKNLKFSINPLRSNNPKDEVSTVPS